jgi:hypothetical protein
MDCVSLAQQKLGQVRAVLPGDTLESCAKTMCWGRSAEMLVKDTNRDRTGDEGDARRFSSSWVRIRHAGS